jgi:hypothetical protein
MCEGIKIKKSISSQSIFIDKSHLGKFIWNPIIIHSSYRRKSQHNFLDPLTLGN